MQSHIVRAHLMFACYYSTCI